MAAAYAVRHPELEIEGLPAWARYGGKRWAVEASAGEAAAGLPSAASRALTRQMLQTMLAGRFQLKLHTEMRPASIYELRLAGTGLKTAAPAAAEGTARPGLNPGCNAAMGDSGGRIIANGASLADIAGCLTTFLQREVVDKTGLGGYYNFDIHWKADAFSGGSASDDLGPSGIAMLITQINDQLGLKLVNAKGTEEHWVVDHVALPLPN
jgi:bla regulator protein blaR1